MNRVRRIELVAGIIAVAVVAWYLVTPSSGTVRISADFTSTVGVYPGSEVRLMGVPIGKVISVTPEPGLVHVTMEYDSRYQLPATADAVIVSPSVVADRFVQLTPAYSGSGPTLAGGTNLPLSRTHVPVELDEIYRTAHDLLDALGPRGANRSGAVNRLLRTSAANLAGNGLALHDMLHALAGASSTLNAGSGDFYASVVSLRDLTATLASSDGDVRAFNDEMAQAMGFLASERQSLGALLDNFAGSFAAISQFVRSNRHALSQDVTGLREVTTTLVAERTALEEITRTIPLGLDNLNRTWDTQAQGARTRSNETQVLSDLHTTICDAIIAAGVPDPTLVCQVIRAVLGGR